MASQRGCVLKDMLLPSRIVMPGLILRRHGYPNSISPSLVPAFGFPPPPDLVLAGGVSLDVSRIIKVPGIRRPRLDACSDNRFMKKAHQIVKIHCFRFNSVIRTPGIPETTPRGLAELVPELYSKLFHPPGYFRKIYHNRPI